MLSAVVMVSLATELSAVMWRELEYFGAEDSCTDMPYVRAGSARLWRTAAMQAMKFKLSNAWRA